MPLILKQLILTRAPTIFMHSFWVEPLLAYRHLQGDSSNYLIFIKVYSNKKYAF